LSEVVSILVKMNSLKLKTVPWQPQLCANLKGCNSVTGEIMASPFKYGGEHELKLTTSNIPSSETKTLFERFDNVTKMCKSLDVSASLSMHMALSGAGGSANASFVNDIALSSNSVSLYVMIKKDYEAEYVDNVEQFWGETTRGVEPSEIDEKAFQKAYGDSFICGSLRSVVMMGKMKFEYSQHSDKETVEAAVDAAISAWGGTMEASTRVKDHLEQAEKNSKTTFELYQTGMKDACDVPTTLTQMLDLMKGFTRNINHDAAAHYQAIIMPYSALHGYGGFKDGTAAASSIARESALADSAEDFYELKKVQKYLHEVFRRSGDFRPPGKGKEQMTQRQMDAWLCKNFDGNGDYTFKGSWKEKVAELDAAVKKVLEQYLDSSAAAFDIVPRLSTLGIYREEMPVRAGVQPDASGSHENPGWTQLPGNILLQFGSVSATNKNIKEATEGQLIIYLQSLAGDNEVEVRFARPFKKVASVTCTLSDVGQKINRPTTAVGAYSVTTEGFKAAVKATGPYEDVKVYWTAMGYC
jgi:hypothetical protein